MPTFNAHTFNLSDYDSTRTAGQATQNGKIASRDFGEPESVGVLSFGNLASTIAVIARNGDLATTDRVRGAQRECTDLLLPAARSIKPVWQERQLCGTRVNLEAALAGHPRAWGRYSRQPSAGLRTVALYVPIGGRALYSVEEIGWAAVAGIVIVDLLESAGYRVEVWGASFCTHRTPQGTALRTLLKRAEEPADLHAISRIAHPALFRGLIMGLRRTLASAGDAGGTVAVEPAVFGDENAITVQHTYSLEAAVAEIKRVIAQFGEGAQ